MNSQGYFAHPKALVDEGAEIGKGTRIWAFSHVMGGAKIGENCNLCDYSFVERGVVLGNQVTVKNGVQIYEGVTVEDGVFLGPNSVFTNDMWPRSFIKPPKEKWLEKTLLREGCTIGANATIVCGITVGRFAFVGAGSVVTKDVPDYALVVGVPARAVGWLCRCTAKLNFTENKTRCAQCGCNYEISGKSVRQLSK